MARMLNSFNAAASDKLGDFTPVPAGVYIAQIEKSEMKETKNGEGHYLELMFKIIDGEHANRPVYERLNLHNANPQTVEIAQKTLATICEICAIDVLDDSEDLHNIPMSIKVVVIPAKAQYGESNGIKGYEAIEGGVPKAARAGVAVPPRTEMAATTGIPSGKKTPPWNKA